MRFGPNRKRILLRRRAATDHAGGVERGDYADAFHTWASWRAQTGQPLTEAGFVQDDIGLVLRVNRTANNRTISIADRIVFNGEDYAIASVSPPDRLGGFIEISLKRHIGG